MTSLAHARIIIWEGGSLWVTDSFAPPDRAQTASHAHHAIQITFTMGGAMEICSGDLAIGGAAVAVAPDTQHAFQAFGIAGHLFVDPDSRQGRIIARTLLRDAPIAEVPPELLKGFTEPILAHFHAPKHDGVALEHLGRAMVDRLSGGVVGDAPDFRVRKMMAAAMQRLDEPVSLTDFEGIGGLSASRLRHLFVEQIGLPFRTYLLWLRISRALEGYAAGEPLTHVAHEAGFADSAHFSRTFKRMFGITPTTLKII